MKNPINWFEVPVLDMDRAKSFYEEIFQIEIKLVPMGDDLMGWFPVDPNSSGCTGTLLLNKDQKPSKSGVMIYFSVEEITDVADRIAKAGGEIVKPKFEIGEGHGFCSVFDDTEGNRLALHQNA